MALKRAAGVGNTLQLTKTIEQTWFGIYKIKKWYIYNIKWDLSEGHKLKDVSGSNL